MRKARNSQSGTVTTIHYTFSHHREEKFELRKVQLCGNDADQIEMMGREEIESMDHKRGLLPRSFNIRAAFGLSYEVVGVKPVCITIALVFLLAIGVLVVPITRLTYQNSSTDARVKALTAQVNALVQQVQTLHRDLKNLQHLHSIEEKQKQDTDNSTQDIDDYEDDDEMFHHESRIKRASNAKPKKKNEIFVKQFRGRDSEAHVSLNGYIGNWLEDDWGVANSKIKFDQQTEGIEVTKSGIYLLTAQLTFAHYVDGVDYTLQIQPANKPAKDRMNISKCFVPRGDKDGELSHTCSTSLFVCLNKSDKLYVYVRMKDVEINMGNISSLIGLARVSKVDSCNVH